MNYSSAKRVLPILFCLLSIDLIINQTQAQVDTINRPRMYGTDQTSKLPRFDVSLKLFEDPASIYYIKKIELKLTQLDTSLTAEQILGLTKYKITKSQISADRLNKLANQIYQFNEDKKYSEAVEIGQKILSESPNNITGHKELALAYQEIGADSLSALHLGMMIKIIKSMFVYADGTYEFPFIVNNFFEGISIYEAAFRCRPSKMVVMLDKTNRLLGAYNCYSSQHDQIYIRYSELSHWRKDLKKGDYIIEGQ